MGKASRLFLKDAPYLLEPVACTFASEDIQVQLALLSAASKLFFKRPPECQLLLGSVLLAAAADSNQDVHDRAVFYYRLFQQGVEEAKRVIHPPLPSISAFSEDQGAELRDRIFDEFNSLAVVYQQPSSSFVQQAAPAELLDNALGDQMASQTLADEGSSLLSQHEQTEAIMQDPTSPAPNGALSTGASHSPPPQPTAAAAPLVDLLGGNDVLGGLGGLSLDTPSTAAQTSPPPSLQLQPNPVLSPAEFQSKWGSLQPVSQFPQQLSTVALSLIKPTGQQGFCQHLGKAHIATMASGGQPPNFRFYFHAAQAPGTVRFLVEMLVNTAAGSAAVTIKSDAPADSVPLFTELLKSSLSSAS